MTGGAAAPLSSAAVAVEPPPATYDPQSLFESVTVTQDLPPSPVLARRSPARPPLRLALIGLGAGLATVALGFAGIKLVRGTKRAPAVAVSAPNPAAALGAERASGKVEEARPAAPVAAALPEAPARADREAPTRNQPEDEPTPVDRAPAHRAAAERTTSHRHGTSHRGKRHERHGSHMKVVVYHPAAKRGTASPEHADPRTPYEHGNALLFAGDGKGAIAAYREAVRSAPSDPIGFRGLGLAYEQQGESAQAVRALRRYLKLAPNAPDREIISRRIERLSKSAKKS
jgi:tetratricopeptide (TPR) repeat protein